MEGRRFGTDGAGRQCASRVGRFRHRGHHPGRPGARRYRISSDEEARGRYGDILVQSRPEVLMKKYGLRLLGVALIAAAAAFAGVALAQQSSPPAPSAMSIGIVDVPYIMQNSAAAKQIRI